MILVFALALAMGSIPDRVQAARPFDEAEQLARSGRTDEAKQRFERMVLAQPADVDARVWLARLLKRAGKIARAEEEFRRALDYAPDHADALTGLATVLHLRGAFGEASALLDRAERLSPENADVLAARAQGLRLSGRFGASETYYARARALSPRDQDIRDGLEQTRRLNRHRVEANFFAESIDDSTPAARAADLNVDVRAADALRLHARVQTYSRDPETAGRVGAGVQWRPRLGLTVRASALVAPGAGAIARSDQIGEIEHVRGRVELGIGVRSMSFADADVWVFAPAGTVWVSDRTAVTGRYYLSRTAFEFGPIASHHSGAVRLRHQLHPRVWVDTAYARGFESFETVTTERLGHFRADTYAGGMLLHLSGLQSISAAVEYQRRGNRQSMVRITLGLAHRF